MDICDHCPWILQRFASCPANMPLDDPQTLCNLIIHSFYIFVFNTNINIVYQYNSFYFN